MTLEEARQAVGQQVLYVPVGFDGEPLPRATPLVCLIDRVGAESVFVVFNPAYGPASVHPSHLRIGDPE